MDCTQYPRSAGFRSGLSYDGKLNVGWGGLGSIRLNVFHPLMMGLETIGRNSENLDVAFREVISTSCHLSELSCADRRKVIRMREEDGLSW